MDWVICVVVDSLICIFCFIVLVFCIVMLIVIVVCFGMYIVVVLIFSFFMVVCCIIWFGCYLCVIGMLKEVNSCLLMNSMVVCVSFCDMGGNCMVLRVVRLWLMWMVLSMFVRFEGVIMLL